MMTYRPRAAMMPPISALPYPFSPTGTTRAPASAASRWLPSVLPLSATTTSPLIPLSARNRLALRTEVATVSASSMQGMTTVSSTVARLLHRRRPAVAASPGRASYYRRRGTDAPSRPPARCQRLSAQHGRVRLEGSAWRCLARAFAAARGHRRARTGKAARAGGAHLAGSPDLRHRAHPRRAAARRRRARLPVAGLVQRLVRVPLQHRPLLARPDPGVRVLHLAQDPGAVPQLRPYNNPATSDGPGRRRHGIRAGQAALRRPRLAGHAGGRPGALRRIPDRARAPGHAGRAVPLPAHAGRDAAAVGPPRPVAAPLRAGGAAARRRRHGARGRAAAAGHLRRVPDHQGVRLAEGRGHDRDVPDPGARLRGPVRRRARAVRDERRHRGVPVLAGDDVRRVRQDAGAGG